MPQKSLETLLPLLKSLLYCKVCRCDIVDQEQNLYILITVDFFGLCFATILLICSVLIDFDRFFAHNGLHFPSINSNRDFNCNK